MKKIILKTPVEVYPSEKELAKKDLRLIRRAKKALKDSWSPYSGFQVGAAVLLANGKIIGGSNQENAAYPLCLCAERVAIAAADSVYPGIPILAIAVTAKSVNQVVDAPVSPCGSCRQVICETEGKHETSMRIILQGEIGKVYVLASGNDLLPLSFDATQL